jgi:cytochrome c553
MPLEPARASLRLAALLALAAGSCLAQGDPAAVPAFKELDSMAARVQGCVTCHGQQGQGTSND